MMKINKKLLKVATQVFKNKAEAEDEVNKVMAKLKEDSGFDVGEVIAEFGFMIEFKKNYEPLLNTMGYRGRT